LWRSSEVLTFTLGIQILEFLSGRADRDHEGGFTMLWTIAVILLLLWAVGLVSSYTLGGFVHLLLVLAIIVVLIRVIQGRSPVL